MPVLYTIGHSTRTIAEFIDILHAHKIKQIVDVRSIPKSRLFPWFNQDELTELLKEAKIHYIHIANLGGLRHAVKQSINTGWINASFRGFADYMQTPPFFLGLKELNQIVKSKRKTAIMCAEAVPWRCHRSLIADAEIARGVKVFDIFDKTHLKPHVLTAFAVIDRTVKPIRVYYPSPNLSLNC